MFSVWSLFLGIAHAATPGGCPAVLGFAGSLRNVAALEQVHGLPRHQKRQYFVGKPMATLDAAYLVLERLRTGDRHALEPVGIAELPADFRINSVEWGIVHDRTERTFHVISGDGTGVSASSDEGRYVIVGHSHPDVPPFRYARHWGFDATPFAMGHPAKLLDVLGNTASLNASPFFPSLADIQTGAHQRAHVEADGVELHVERIYNGFADLGDGRVGRVSEFPNAPLVFLELSQFVSRADDHTAHLVIRNTQGNVLWTGDVAYAPYGATGYRFALSRESKAKLPAGAGKVDTQRWPLLLPSGQSLAPHPNGTSAAVVPAKYREDIRVFYDSDAPKVVWVRPNFLEGDFDRAEGVERTRLVLDLIQKFPSVDLDVFVLSAGEDSRPASDLGEVVAAAIVAEIPVSSMLSLVTRLATLDKEAPLKGVPRRELFFRGVNLSPSMRTALGYRSLRIEDVAIRTAFQELVAIPALESASFMSGRLLKIYCSAPSSP